MVRLELRRAQRAPQLRQGAAEAHRRRHLRQLRHEALSALAGQVLLRPAQQGVQVLPRLRELQLQGLHHREVLRQRPRVSGLKARNVTSDRWPFECVG